METWILKVNTMYRLKAFEMWILRSFFKIPWTDHLINNEDPRGLGHGREPSTSALKDSQLI